MRPLEVSAASRQNNGQGYRENMIRYTSKAEADRVPFLPGLGQVNGFNLFAGYITVNEESGRALFYVFTESMSATKGDDALVLWLNGGPGCSSVGGGFMSEIGPYFPNPDTTTLKSNPYAWNKIANMLYVESPAFVGFSYSNSSEDKVVGDLRTAEDMVIFLKQFLERFPHLAENELYLSGESYAGHYLPNLAAAIIRSNEMDSKPQSRLNLVGFMVGNPWTDAPIDNSGTADYWHSHALISDDVYAGIKDNCDMSNVGPLSDPNKNELCEKWCEKVPHEMGNINIYQILADVCLVHPAPSAAAFLRHLGPNASGLLALKLRIASGRLSQSATGAMSLKESSEDACIDWEVQNYLNIPEVQKALHVRPTVWSDCTDDITYSRDDLLSSMIPTYQDLLWGSSSNLRILVFSGDIDGMVPVVGTRRWVASLGLEIKTKWHPWLNKEDGQVAGYTVSYERGLTLATVRGAGHMVPYVQPSRAFHLLESFITDKPLH